MPQIENYENRAEGVPNYSPEHAFGYVYFDDGSRVGYVAGIPDPDQVFEPRTNGGGKHMPVSRDQLLAAAEYLRQQGIPVRDPQ